MDSIPGYDRWKLATPPEYEITEEEENAIWENDEALELESLEQSLLDGPN